MKGKSKREILDHAYMYEKVRNTQMSHNWEIRPQNLCFRSYPDQAPGGGRAPLLPGRVFPL